jgi:hypothetical protein
MEPAASSVVVNPHGGEHNVRDLILEKRDIFVSQMQIDTKREALQRLEDIERQQEQNLLVKEAELSLFRDQFRRYLEDDGRNTMAVRNAAEIRSRRRVEVSDQIKSVSAAISKLRSEIARSKEKLKECQDYRVFLDSLTPPDWRSQHPLPEMFFTSPAQLLDIMATLEQQTMFLISHCQDAEETLDTYRARFNLLMETRDGSMVSMQEERRRRDAEVREMAAHNDRYTAPVSSGRGTSCRRRSCSSCRRASATSTWSSASTSRRPMTPQQC